MRVGKLYVYVLRTSLAVLLHFGQARGRSFAPQLAFGGGVGTDIPAVFLGAVCFLSGFLVLAVVFFTRLAGLFFALPAFLTAIVFVLQVKFESIGRRNVVGVVGLV